MEIKLLSYPTAADWLEVKRRALVTVGLNPVSPPEWYWCKKMLAARHSPIRYLRFSFLLKDIPYWVSVHLCRHVHSQPYVRSQRNDRQSQYNRNDAPQDAPVTMIWDMNAEELMVIANKRLCQQAAPETREVVRAMCGEVLDKAPEFADTLVPMCKYGKCHEMYPCYKKGENK